MTELLLWWEYYLLIFKQCMCDSSFLKFPLKNTLLALLGAIFHTTSGGLVLYSYVESESWIGLSVGSLLILQAVLMLVETVLQGKNMKKQWFDGIYRVVQKMCPLLQNSRPSVAKRLVLTMHTANQTTTESLSSIIWIQRHFFCSTL